jgi:hypothetical protein
MPNRKEMPKQTFSKKGKKGGKIMSHRGHLMAIKWRDLWDVYILSTAHDSEVIEVKLSRENTKK